MTKITAKLSNGMTLTVEFHSKAGAQRAALHLIADYAAEGVSVTELRFDEAEG